MDLRASTDMWITTWIIVRVTMALFLRAANVQGITGLNFTARQCMTRAAVRPLADTNSGNGSHDGVARDDFAVPLRAELGGPGLRLEIDVV